MKTRIFRDIISSEINKTIKTLKGKKDFDKYKTDENQKSFAFLYWFVKRYYPNITYSDIESYIVEGTDDGSCDIIFSNKDRRNKLTYYVIQSKWFTEKKVGRSNKTSESVKSCLSDFSLIIEGEKKLSKTNQKFNENYKKLLKHVENNGNVKFIFLALCKKTQNAESNIKKFNNDYGNLIVLNLYDINKLKTDYIELEFKQAKTHNPIETPYEPIEDIDLCLDVKNSIKVSSPDESYIFLVKPKLIFEIFKKYQFSIFYRNIRNPLFSSSFNSSISETLIERPNRFWYYNNGITAITNKVYDFNSKGGKKITIKGMQVINGAQTVYSIYKAYSELNEIDKDYIDDRALITLRIITSSDQDEDIKITKYTNSQNPVTPRDFHSNDPVQKSLQNDFFENTNLWYETRRGEFRKKLPKKLGVKVITNELLGQTYLSYYFKKPIIAKSSKKNLFTSKKESKNGLYELIFNHKVDYQDMEISYKLYQIVEKRRKENYKKVKKIELKEYDDYTKDEKNIVEYQFLQYTSFNILSILKVLFEKINISNLEGLNGKILIDLDNKDGKKVTKYYEYIIQIMKDLVELKSDSNKFKTLHYFKLDRNSVKEVEESVIKNISATVVKTLAFK